MARIVHRFPPVYVAGAEWTVDQPINRSRRLWDRGVVTSGGYRKRRVAAMQTISIANYGGGYISALTDLLEGGEALVRLYSYAPNHNGSTDRQDRQSWPLGWRTAAGDPLTWQNASGAVRWFTGVADAVAGDGLLRGEILGGANGFGETRLSGLPPNRIVVEPGEFVAFYPTLDSYQEGQFQRRRALRPATSNADGVAIVWTVTRFGYDAGTQGFANIGVRDTGVFMADSIPRAMRTPGADWPYDWTFTEVFEDETPGGFIERNPWGPGNAQGD